MMRTAYEKAFQFVVEMFHIRVSVGRITSIEKTHLNKSCAPYASYRWPLIHLIRITWECANNIMIVGGMCILAISRQA